MSTLLSIRDIDHHYDNQLLRLWFNFVNFSFPLGRSMWPYNLPACLCLLFLYLSAAFWNLERRRYAAFHLRQVTHYSFRLFSICSRRCQ